MLKLYSHILQTLNPKTLSHYSQQILQLFFQLTQNPLPKNACSMPWRTCHDRHDAVVVVVVDAAVVVVVVVVFA